jgi:hypothetical protein
MLTAVSQVLVSMPYQAAQLFESAIVCVATKCAYATAITIGFKFAVLTHTRLQQNIYYKIYFTKYSNTLPQIQNMESQFTSATSQETLYVGGVCVLRVSETLKVWHTCALCCQGHNTPITPTTIYQ